MKEIVIIKYGELSTKKGNINYFLKTLKSNIKSILNDYQYSIYYDRARMIIESDEIHNILNNLKYVFGIHSYTRGFILYDNEMDNIYKESLNIVNNLDFRTFKVKTKRQDKRYPLTSMEISRKVGGYILKNKKDISVDVHNPDMLLNIELRNDNVLIYTNEVAGIGGYPVGTQGKSLLMLSGGIDSPVAGYLALKRGMSLDLIYFDSPPHTSIKAKNKVIKLAKTLKKYDPSINLYVANITKIQEDILKYIPNGYLITILRRMMYRISLNLANQHKYLSIVNGESIGQVASQTLTSMKVIDELSTIPIIRPVACLDKLEIIKIAKDINSYDISIEPYDDCCTIFVPKHPVINPKSEICIEYEKLIDVDKLLSEVVIKEESLISEEFTDLL